MTETAPNHVEWKPTLMGELLLFGLLSRVTRSNPEREWFQALITEEVFSESPLERDHADIDTGLHLLQKWSRENKNGISDEQLIALKADYTRLFVGIGKPVSPPWESVYFNEDRMIFQDQTLQVREWYRRFGLESEKLYKEPDDHIGLELSFLAHLAKQGLLALDEKDMPELERILQAQRQFLSEHPLKWISRWYELIKKHATTDFYRGIAHLTHGSLLTIAEELQIEMPKEVRL
ncbi:MAG: molecular chaperone TorD family protein [Anaerolineales bacterium]|nr:MAG: molecular chaperone TorD family protein [Anaerolineales bacterium]